MTSHQDKGWGVSLPSLLFPLNLVKKKVIYEEIPQFVKKNAAMLPDEGWALFRSPENSPAGKVQDQWVKESTSLRDVPSSPTDPSAVAPRSPVHTGEEQQPSCLLRSITIRQDLQLLCRAD